ncbi:uncharacterized protein LOC118647744 [Monomorium pharaonis]|uniref:uncharacterized protein LOC118647744 n=1 Tax=Monomorium pharaonis TaxID=307658 RepID=UPI001747AD75|nr:uncharacterized protein LOC118647744 [Monomorium pharaonis]
MNTVSRGIVQVIIGSIYDNFSKTLRCLTIPSISDLTPSEVFPRNTIKIPANIRLADPEFHLPRSIELLIGSGATLSLFSVGQINLSRSEYDLYLQKTRLGWIVAGGQSPVETTRREESHLTTLGKLLEKFWITEEITDHTGFNEQDKCEIHYRETTSRDASGKYIVRLPFDGSGNRLGDSRHNALKRLLSLERKLEGNANLKNEYTRVIDEYIRSNYLSVVESPNDDGYYMPHHAVVKETSNTTKIRLVFDASAKTSSGFSLNDTLRVGPTLQDKLFAHLIRFRTYACVLVADIEKMYLQVLLHEDDRRYQRILWRINDNVKTLQFNTLTFGVSSSPYLAIRTIHQLADDERKAYPRAAEVLKTHLYVDDLLTGAETLDEAREIRDEIIALLNAGGINIRQWASNDKRAVHDLMDNALHANFVFDKDPSLRTLGIIWSAGEDRIRYSVREIKITKNLTKRIILAEISKIYDPLGLLGPVILYAKKLMQDVWRSQLKWDESLPQSIYTAWTEFARQLELLNHASFDRRVLTANPQDIQIHGFCDASMNGYGACIYIRAVKNERVIVNLLCAKSRVAPLKTITIPRLELNGAVLLVRLYREAARALNIKPAKTIFWSDSTIVLQWIRTSPHLLNTFVANRVTEIQDVKNPHEWRHVRTRDNPADALSRGQLPHEFSRNQQWFEGPEWLRRNENEWPNDVIQSVELPELRKTACLITMSTEPDLFGKYSSYVKLTRIMAYCRRFRPNNAYNGPLCLTEIDEAEKHILKIIQASRFPNEIKELKRTNIATRGRIVNLNPFLDNEGILRVGGRLRMSDMTYAQKHPILIPSRHHVTDLIIREIHERYHHVGIQNTLHHMRQKFWVTDGRNQVRKIIRTCVRCTRFRADAAEYKMGDLPSTRIRKSVPFTYTGVDFCGPFYIKERKHRNRVRVKVYICVFVCLTVKAVHLEVVSDLTTDGFIASLRRFIARRGCPEHIYSDNGTNFTGAQGQLREIYACLNSEIHKNAVDKFALEHKITWHFIPPAAPHFGGLWESMVKLFKHHLKRVVGESLFTFEQLNTFANEVEGILNSRPITSLSSDPNDLLVLTPAHYLIGRPLTTLPEGDLTCVPVNRLTAWQHVSKMRQDFWARWHLEYLNELQARAKWAKDGPSLNLGDVVLIKDRNLPCTQWKMGRVTETHPGEDGITRSVTVKTTNGNVNRAVKYLCPLPVDKA